MGCSAQKKKRKKACEWKQKPASLWFSVVHLHVETFHVHGVFQTLSLESQYIDFKTYFAIEMNLNKVKTLHGKSQI